MLGSLNHPHIDGTPGLEESPSAHSAGPWQAVVTALVMELVDREWDLAPDGKRVAVLTPVESAGTPTPDHEVVFLLNVFDTAAAARAGEEMRR